MEFKTGGLYQRERSTASLVDGISKDVTDSRNGLRENVKWDLPTQSKNYVDFNFHKDSSFRPSVDYGAVSSSSSGDQYNDFLKQIDRQIEESRKLFPDSFK